MSALLCCLALLAASDDHFLSWSAHHTELKTLPPSAGRRLSSDELAKYVDATPTLPFGDVTAGIDADTLGTWIGSHQGLMFLPPGGDRWRVFHSRRWLPADDVQDLSISSDGTVYVQTPAGIGLIVRRETSLEKKMLGIDKTLQKYHVRDGVVAEVNSPTPGDLSTARIQTSNDNDGLWTSMYVAAEAFRYGTTGDAAAKQNARRSLEALMFLERVSTIPGFVARSDVPIDDDPKRTAASGIARPTTSWWWKARHIERRGRRPLLRLLDLLRRGRRRRGESTRFAHTSSESPTTFSITA